MVLLYITKSVLSNRDTPDFWELPPAAGPHVCFCVQLSAFTAAFFLPISAMLRIVSVPPAYCAHVIFSFRRKRESGTDVSGIIPENAAVVHASQRFTPS